MTDALEYPRCHICGNPAACLGRYDTMEQPAYACNDCCGHGNEDGWCWSLDEIPEKVGEALAEAVTLEDERLSLRERTEAAERELGRCEHGVAHCTMPGPHLPEECGTPETHLSFALEAAEEEIAALRQQLADACQARDRADLVARQADETASATEAKLAETKTYLWRANATIISAVRALYAIRYEAGSHTLPMHSRPSKGGDGLAYVYDLASEALADSEMARVEALDNARREVCEAALDLERCSQAVASAAAAGATAPIGTAYERKGLAFQRYHRALDALRALSSPEESR